VREEYYEGRKGGGGVGEGKRGKETGVGAYGTFVKDGSWVEPIFVTRIEDKNGNILEEFMPKKKEAIRKQSAYIICKMLERVTMSGGTAARLRSAQFGIPGNVSIGGKTGTTQNHSVGGFMGITRNLVSGCWVGADERNVHFRNTRYGQGANMALPIFGHYMRQVYADPEINYGRGFFKKPEIEMTIDLDCENYTDGEENGFEGDETDDDVDDKDLY